MYQKHQDSTCIFGKYRCIHRCTMAVLPSKPATFRKTTKTNNRLVPNNPCKSRFFFPEFSCRRIAGSQPSILMWPHLICLATATTLGTRSTPESHDAPGDWKEDKAHGWGRQGCETCWVLHPKRWPWSSRVPYITINNRYIVASWVKQLTINLK